MRDYLTLPVKIVDYLFHFQDLNDQEHYSRMSEEHTVGHLNKRILHILSTRLYRM